jgi:hypothetical protein
VSGSDGIKNALQRSKTTMLDVIADFWKPVKKVQQQEKLQDSQLQVGSSIGFGFVPQALLSGRRLTVSGINTYQFGVENLTSYVLSQDREPSVSMIVAEADDDQYLAISRRIPLEERSRLFDAIDLESALTNPDAARLACKDNVPDFKGWLVNSYKREINGLKGRIYKGDHRKIPLPATSEGQDFNYTLLVSDSNEHALEIEQYVDGRMEVYATIYRRINDVGEISHPVGEMVTRPDIKLAAKREEPANDSSASAALLEPVVVHKPVEAKAAVEARPEATKPAAEPEAAKTDAPAFKKLDDEVAATKQPEAAKPAPLTPVSQTSIEVKPVQAAPAPLKAEVPAVKSEMKEAAPKEAVKMQAAQFNVAAEPPRPLPMPQKTDAKAKVEPKPLEVKTEAKVPVVSVPAKAPEPLVEASAEAKKTQETTTPIKTEEKPAAVAATVAPNDTQKENNTMSNNEVAAVNGSHAESKPTLYVHNNGQEPAQNVKAVTRSHTVLENDSVECDLRVANKLIDEAIRNEMRLNDVVRRVIELPVANPESVQIPVTLTDDDYSLLAIRYGISASDRNAIKQRIIEDLNAFSGEN